MEKEPKSREGIKGWINPAKYGKFGIERFAWILMRITGLGLLAYFIAHIYETSNILNGKEVWDEMLAMTQTTEGHIFLALVIGMCVFHTGNGIRLMLVQMGYGVSHQFCHYAVDDLVDVVFLASKVRVFNTVKERNQGCGVDPE